MQPIEAAPSRYAEFIDALKGVAVQPLWDRYHRLTRRAPSAPDTPWHWPWAVMEPMVERATREVALEDAERRVLLLANPAFPDTAACTTTLSAGLQTLLPGEVARAHRHTLAAIRFVMQGHGAVTCVNDDPCPMSEGDLVLTPAWTWHEHTHPGSGRVVWFDGLDLPLARYLDCVFLELGSQGRGNADPAAPRPSTLPALGASLRPDASDPHAGSRSRWRYGWERALSALGSAPEREDGSRWLRYVDMPGTGPVLPTLDCYLHGCAAGRATTARRSTSNAVCVVVRGQGESRVGEQRFAWRTHDVFSVPHWNWVSHTAQGEDALIFMMTDREFMAGIGYLREEVQA